MTTRGALTVEDLLDVQQAYLSLQWVAGKAGQVRPIELATARYPGLTLIGYFSFIHPSRVQVLGDNELQYLERLDESDRLKQLRELFVGQRSALFIVADDHPVPDLLVQLADEHKVALLSSPLPCPRLIDALQYFLSRALAERITVHGVFMEVIGAGILLTGESGIGKSEIALELLSRNHRLIADDAVEIRRIGPSTLEGYCPEALHGFLEVRGLGILNIREMFSETATLQKRELDLIVHFEQMKTSHVRHIDRLQAEKKTRNILNVEIPEVLLLVAPGRNLAVLVEAAVRDYILRSKGKNPLEAFVEKQKAMISLQTPEPDDAEAQPSEKAR